MPSYIALGVLSLVLFYFVNVYRDFHRNLSAAKASGLVYIPIPLFPFSKPWMALHLVVIPLLQKLPTSWTDPWITYIHPEWLWLNQFSKFKELGTDTFITVSPGRNIVYTADATVINQITTRRNDFPKPVALYIGVDVYGKNVVSTEGAAWKHQRKITSPPFTEKSNRVVWIESLRQAELMLTSWVGSSGDGPRSVATVAADTMRLSLHVISRAGFGQQLVWPGENDNPQAEKASLGPGHTMTYTEALQTLLHYFAFVIILPLWFLKYAPFRITKLTYTARMEWGMYMNEMFQAKKAQIAAGDEGEGGMDLMGALARGAGLTAETLSAKSAGPPKQLLTDDEIMGNAFVFILAGHETAANSIHFSILFLALHTASQRTLQSDLDEIFAGKPTSQWDYDRDLPKLFSSMAGAILAEELRLVPPVVGIPKSTPKHQAQTLTLRDGKKVTVPADSLINLVSIGVHRNPAFWPSGPPSDPADPVHPSSNLDNDLEEFKPERWLTETTTSSSSNKNKKSLPASASAASAPGAADPLFAPPTLPATKTGDLGLDLSADTAASFYRPPKGAYIPFSEGFRACLGRRFAQVEVLAVLAVLFHEYSVELAVDEWASDEEVEGMGEGGKREVWGRARARARGLMTGGMGTIVTLQMRGGVVPVRFVRRGGERFAF